VGRAVQPQMSYKVATLVKCNDISLKITLTDKHVTKSLVECLINPFLGAYNKKVSTPVTWEDVKCVQVDGFTLFDPHQPAKGLLKTDQPVVKLVMSIDGQLPQAFIEKAQAHIEHLGPAAVEAGTKAADIEEMPPDADVERRCDKAYNAIRGDAEAPSRATVVAAFIDSTTKGGGLRQLSYIEFSKHTKALDHVLNTIEVDERAVDFEEFTAFFAAISAAACAPVSSVPRPAYHEDIPTDGIVGGLLNTPGAEVRRVA